jgi:molybdopterin synthase sulfur carrier subunit
MSLRLLYFARLADLLGVRDESLDPPAGVADVAGIQALLAARPEPWAEAFSGARIVRCAVNQDLATPDTQVKDGDELAFFPPVTGG